MATCKSTLLHGDDRLHCHLDPDHTEPTDEQPQGAPHEDAKHKDTLTGDPHRWWG